VVVKTTAKRAPVREGHLTKGGKQMIGMLRKVKELFVSEEGATATEYAVMLALIIIVAIAAITLLGEKVNNTFNNIANAMPG
jgi:pilus assembly protein Flp/PilA